jgi:hypothetical protein
MKVLRQVWSVWQRFGHFMGDLLARLVLTVFYFTILLPFGLIVTLFSDPLHLKRNAQQALWLARQTGDQTLDEARRQF